MAAGAVCHVQGGSIDQIEDAAEVILHFLVSFFSSLLPSQVGMEHNIGLSCDPIGGLVQIPCIERNVMGAAKAVASARLALLEDGKGMVRELRVSEKRLTDEWQVSLDEICSVMLSTGLEMSTKYKETAGGGLAKQTRISSNVTIC
jgi:L-serine dehydratase